MPNITFANTKGGSGKTTATLALASELVAAGARVALVEGDPNRPLATWAEGRDAPVIDTAKHRIRDAEAASAILREAARDQNLIVITTDNDDETVLEWLEAAEGWATFVLADPEGSPNQWMNLVISQADLVIVPFAPTTLDALQVTRTLRQIKQTEKISGKTILHKVLLTRCNPGAVMTRDERDIRTSLVKHGVELMTVSLADRPAFRGMFKHDALLSELTDAETNGLHHARANAAAYVEEVIELLRSNEKREAA
jgi:chromosome partitioning protein